ncbi:hypothetical protein TNCV_4429451 [Trichonephila clavipes]|nr:hypothetical protein TNCV_4429451 [Trichonephila clavipes]
MYRTTPMGGHCVSTDLASIGSSTRYTRAFGDGPRNFEHGQVTRTTPKLELPSPNYHTTPKGGRLSS